MAFSKKTKLLAKKKSAFRCCLCHKPFVEIHHIIPQSEGGSDELDNFAPLCSSCHDLYGGNPEKRRTMRQMRDYWWELIEKRNNNLTDLLNLDEFCEIKSDKNWEGMLHSKGVVLYHAVFEEENFEVSVYHIHRLLKIAQDTSPNKKRFLYIDIDGHRNKNGGFDHDMYELQRHFLLGFLAPYFTEIYMPLGLINNKKAQRNNVPETIEIIEKLDQNSINQAIDKGISSIWVADKDKLIKFE
ncbi:HNH endonuclease [Nostoc sp.]|uniref:HNH endonuclease n=1 Tax=Nostoc sp. TaxID=1180 RepID=UPI002FFC6F02